MGTARPAWQRTHVAIAIGLLGFVLSAVAKLMTRSAEPEPGALAVFILTGEKATSAALGMTLTVPSPWARIDLQRQPGMDFVVQHPTGIRFIAAGDSLQEGMSVERILAQMLDIQRKRHGDLRDVQWGEESIAGLKARTLSFTVVHGPQGPARSKAWTVTKGQRWAMLNCGGPESVFSAAGEKACREIVDSLTLQPN